jgi:hypothetical protein
MEHQRRPLRELFWDYRTNLDAYPAFHFAAYDWNCAQYITPRFTRRGAGKRRATGGGAGGVAGGECAAPR